MTCARSSDRGHASYLLLGVDTFGVSSAPGWLNARPARRLGHVIGHPVRLRGGLLLTSRLKSSYHENIVEKQEGACGLGRPQRCCYGHTGCRGTTRADQGL